MTPRRAKRYINQSSEWIVFSQEEKSGEYTFRSHFSSDEAWGIILNLCIKDRKTREVLRNILKQADEHNE